MIKVSVFLTRRPDLTHEQFSQYWKDKHASLLMRLKIIHIRMYGTTPNSTRWTTCQRFPILPYDGVAEEWFDDLSSAVAVFNHQDYASIVARDEENFLDRAKTVLLLSSKCE